ncbi:MAG: exodeoxyribonuclease III [Candidatus Hydrogenedentes bacterium]|nr:exodeoxyribonuclease III [Candidatus Hydrogenedentota bacterium]
MTTIFSWNVNGVRAAGRNGFARWLEAVQPDVLCIQETKAHPGDVPAPLRDPKGYTSVWHSAKRKGYSGVATYFRANNGPASVTTMGIPRFDAEGRVQVIEYPGFTLINAYYPNSQPERKRLEYKLAFCTAMVKLCGRLRREGKNVIVCGDFNIAHKEIDLARPKQNRNNPGFYPEECARLDRFAAAGYADTFRHFNQEPGHYTWWSYRMQARAKNIGWRLDYHWVNEEFLPQVKAAKIHNEVMGSDHCPVSITLG